MSRACCANNSDMKARPSRVSVTILLRRSLSELWRTTKRIPTRSSLGLKGFGR